jgi:hypothetical protein
MKLNKWTLSLTAIGVASLAIVAQAEEKASSVMTALASTTISGYVDTSAQWNFGTGNDRLPDYKFGGSSKADGFNLNVVQIRLEKPLDEAEWAAGYRVDLWAGPDANTLGTLSTSHESGSASDFAVRQAYVALRMPIGNGLDWKVGVFDSIVGYESVESPTNPNYTRSYGHSIEPQTHTGILGSYRFSDLISASFGVANTKGPSINARAHGEDLKAESSKTYMGSIAVTAPDSLGFLSGSTLYFGLVNGLDENEARADYDANSLSYYVGATLATPVTGLRCGASFDYLDVHSLGGETWSAAGYASYQATEKLSLHFRGEYLRDRGAQKFFTTFATDPGSSTNPDRVLALTGTAQYDLWKNVISRVELRWDHSLSGERTWGKSTFDSGLDTDTGSLRNEWMAALNIIYKF